MLIRLFIRSFCLKISVQYKFEFKNGTHVEILLEQLPFLRLGQFNILRSLFVYDVDRLFWIKIRHLNSVNGFFVHFGIFGWSVSRDFAKRINEYFY